MGAHRPKVGETVKVRVDKLDHERQRIELADADLAAAPASGTGVGATVEGIVRDVLGNGVLVDLADGRTGWLPTRNADLPAGTVLAQRFRRGRELSARVAEEAPDGRRVTLTQLEVASESWRAGESGQAGGFGTLGDLLKGWGKR
jgi:ribosomal protein S1